MSAHADPNDALMWVPPWVVAMLAEWHCKKRSGSIRLNFGDGGIRNATEETVRHPPRCAA